MSSENKPSVSNITKSAASFKSLNTAPTRNTFSASKSNPFLASDSKLLLKKHITSIDLRESTKINDDIMNTAFASSPILSKIQEFQKKE